MLNEPTRKFLRRPAVQAITGLARSTIYAEIAHGRFPKPVRLGSRSVAWVATEIDAWVAGRIAASRNEEFDQATSPGFLSLVGQGPAR